MVEVIRTFTVLAPPSSVVACLRDFSRAVEWDPGTLSCRRLDNGPIAVGARWHNVSKIAGITTELRYELIRLEPDRLVFVGINDTATSTDDIAVSAGEEPGTAVVTYHATIDFHGAAASAAPIAKVVFEKLGDETVARLVRVLREPAPMALSGVVLSSPEPSRLAAFYCRLLNVETEVDKGHWVTVMTRSGVRLSFHHDENYRRPVWPTVDGAQQMMVHLDFDVADVDTACEHARRCGATLADVQPQPDVRVLLDPDGHPFCLARQE
jgi:catechol 2,3-dioxygenase-like lactoylglutathione lyase family enzyme